MKPRTTLRQMVRFRMFPMSDVRAVAIPQIWVFQLAENAILLA
jgi:hypothetical protein